MTRLCIKCKVEKPIEDFLKEKTKDGYGHRCRECVKKYLREYHQKHKDVLNEKAHQRYEKNKTPYLMRSKKRRQSNPKKYKAYLKKWRIKNRDKLNEMMLYKLHHDPMFKIKHTLRNQFRKLVKGENKTNSVLFYLGCSVEFLIGYFEAQFQKGFSWKNYGKVWNIDHIIPCRSFDLTKEEDRKRCFHYTNLRPLLVSENFVKQDRLPSGELARNILTKS